MGTKEYNLTGFNRINIRFAMEFEIVQAETYSVSVSGSDNLIENIRVTLEGDRLVLGYQLGLMSFLVAPFSRARARITLPVLRELNISGAARGAVKGFNSPEDFSIYVTGASHVDVSDFSAGSMKWDLSGASHITGQIKVTGDMEMRVTGASRVELKGSAQDINIDTSGASHNDLRDFVVRNARIRLTGASRSIVNMNGKLDVDLAGASSLEYDGQVTMGDVRVTGASSLKKR